MARLSVLANDLSILSLTRILSHTANWSSSHRPTARNSRGSYLPERYLYKGLANAGSSVNARDRARTLASSNRPDHTPSRLTDEPTMNASALAYSRIFSTVIPEPTSVGTLTGLRNRSHLSRICRTRRRYARDDHAVRQKEFRRPRCLRQIHVRREPNASF
jgi:hypothetical protein